LCWKTVFIQDFCIESDRLPGANLYLNFIRALIFAIPHEVIKEEVQ
jgi:hypothetical protein